MTQDKNDVAAVLAETPCIREQRGDLSRGDCNGHYTKHPECSLAALTAAGYAVVRLPEGVKINHGAKLVHWLAQTTPTDSGTLYAIEDTP